MVPTRWYDTYLHSQFKVNGQVKDLKRKSRKKQKAKKRHWKNAHMHGTIGKGRRCEKNILKGGVLNGEAKFQRKKHKQDIPDRIQVATAPVMTKVLPWRQLGDPMGRSLLPGALAAVCCAPFPPANQRRALAFLSA